MAQRPNPSCRFVEDTYESKGRVGKGTFGEVYKAVERAAPHGVVALKKVIMEDEKEGFPITALREIMMLKRLEHPNVVRLKEVVCSRPSPTNQMKGNVFMVFEYMEHDLSGVMSRLKKEGKGLTLPQIKCYLKQLLEGIFELQMPRKKGEHNYSILHRDMKGANLLISRDNQLKIADFGLAQMYMLNQDKEYTNKVCY